VPADANLVVNATSIGLYPDVDAVVPLELEDVAGRALVADVIPNPPETRLLRTAAELGCETLDGLEMLVEQGRIGFELWTGVEPDVGAMRDALGRAFELA
jgi:shikimate dehydrogenase